MAGASREHSRVVKVLSVCSVNKPVSTRALWGSKKSLPRRGVIQGGPVSPEAGGGPLPP